MATLVRANLKEWEIQSKLVVLAGDLAPPFFFVGKRIVGTFSACEEALAQREINEAITRLAEDLSKGFNADAQRMDWVDSLVWQVLRVEGGGASE